MIDSCFWLCTTQDLGRLRILRATADDPIGRGIFCGFTKDIYKIIPGILELRNGLCLAKWLMLVRSSISMFDVAEFKNSKSSPQNRKIRVLHRYQQSAMPKMHNRAHNGSGLCVQYLLAKKVAVARGHQDWALDGQIQENPTLLACYDCCRERPTKKPFFVTAYEIQSDLGPQVSCLVSLS